MEQSFLDKYYDIQPQTAIKIAKDLLLGWKRAAETMLASRNVAVLNSDFSNDRWHEEAERELRMLCLKHPGLTLPDERLSLQERSDRRVFRLLLCEKNTINALIQFASWRDKVLPYLTELKDKKEFDNYNASFHGAALRDDSSLSELISKGESL